MTYEEFALLAANKGLRAAWDALAADPNCCKGSPDEWECGDCHETVTGDWCLACLKAGNNASRLTSDEEPPNGRLIRAAELARENILAHILVHGGKHVCECCD